MKQLFVLVLLLSPYLFQAQKRLDLVHDNAFAFYDYQEKAFCVLDDSTFLWKYNAKKEIWEKSAIELKLEMPFNKFLTDFVVMSDQGTPVYFVFKGCGVVYVKKGKVIQRHDHSFYHMNQFDGAFFMDKGEPRIYGGYGLFTYKNILTRYDTIEREWFLVTTKMESPPTSIKNLVHSNDQNSYYILDGLKNINGHLHEFDNLWRLDLKSRKWTNLGKLNPNIKGINIEPDYESFQNKNTEYYCFPNMIVKYDFDKMRYRKYILNTTKLYKKILKIGSTLLVCKTTSKPSRYMEITDKTFLDDLEFEDGEILLNQTNGFSILRMILVFLVLISIITLFKVTRKHIKRKHIKNLKSMSLSISQDFNQTEIELLQLLFDNKETGLEISYINDLVNYDDPSIDTIKKRRELLLKDLRYKLSSKFNIPQEEVFLERRMETDRRMKLLFLNKLVKLKF